jgi:type I restriction enzyme, S subunit
MSFQRHKAYKNSGVGWLGDVPEHWETKRIRHLFEVKKRIAGTDGFDVLSITQQGIKIKDIESNDGQLSMDYSKYQFVEVGDFAVNHMDLLTGYVDVASISGVTSPDYRVFSVRNAEECFYRYYLYLFQIGYKRKIFYAFGQGASQLGRWRLPIEQFNNFDFPQPPVLEQVQIASFRETAKIDELVAEQKRLIDLLNEKRQAIISHAVTKGLNPNAPMKNSRVEWLGELPKHWEIKRLKHVSPKITVGIVVEPSKYYREEGVPTLRSLNVLPGKISHQSMVYISESSNELLSKSKLRSGDLVAVRSGQPGTAAVIPPELDGCNCIDLIIVRKPLNGSEHFLCWYLASGSALRQFAEGSDGAIQQHFNIGTA